MLYRLKVIFGLAFCVFGTGLGIAKTPPKPFEITKDQQAIGIVQSALEALGGLNIAATYSDSVTIATASIHETNAEIEVPVTIKTKGSREMRSEMHMPKGLTVRILNNGRSILQRPNGKVQKLSMNNAVGERIEHIPLFSMLSEYAHPDISVQYKGTSQVQGQPVQVVALSYVPSTDPGQGPAFSAATQTLFFIDQTTNLVDKLRYTNHDENDDGTTQQIDVYFSQYQTVDGVAIPFHQATYADGKLLSELVLKSVTFNNGLSDSEFTLPE